MDVNGSFEYVAPRGFDGIASFVYGNQDELGRSANATVYIDYGASIPVAFDDSFSVMAGQTLDIFSPGLLVNDEGGLGSLFVSSFFDPTHGVLDSVVVNGSYRYRAPGGFVGVDTFRYSSMDDLGRASEAIVSIQVTAVPEPSQALLLLTSVVLLARRARGRCGSAAEIPPGLAPRTGCPHAPVCPWPPARLPPADTPAETGGPIARTAARAHVRVPAGVPVPARG